MARIFGAACIYVGHESQVKNPGDYFCTRIGRKPVIMVRGADGKVRVIHNQCAHRGAMVVALEQGNAPEFLCCYHGWTYHLDGRLKAVPLQHGYPREFDAADPKTSMRQGARLRRPRGGGCRASKAPAGSCSRARRRTAPISPPRSATWRRRSTTWSTARPTA